MADKPIVPYGLYRGHSRHTGLNAYAARPATARVPSTIRACAATAGGR
jgi:hypothetical protein